MNFFLRVWGLLTTIPNRLISQWGLVLAAILGLVSSISLILSIPLYADSIYYQTLQYNINDLGSEASLSRPPFAFLFHYYGGWHGPKEWEDIQEVDKYFAESAVNALGLPLEHFGRYVSTDSFRIFPSETTNYSDDRSLAWVTFGFMDDLEDHVEVFEGKFPEPASSTDVEPVEVLIHENLAIELGLQVGERYLAHIQSVAHSGNEITNQYLLEISGIWKPKDLSETYWISNPSFYENVLFIPEQSFSDRVSIYLPDEVFSATTVAACETAFPGWYLLSGPSRCGAAAPVCFTSRCTMGIQSCIPLANYLAVCLFHSDIRSHISIYQSRFSTLC